MADIHGTPADIKRAREIRRRKRSEAARMGLTERFDKATAKITEAKTWFQIEHIPVEILIESLADATDIRQAIWVAVSRVPNPSAPDSSLNKARRQGAEVTAAILIGAALGFILGAVTAAVTSSVREERMDDEDLMDEVLNRYTADLKERGGSVVYDPEQGTHFEPWVTTAQADIESELREILAIPQDDVAASKLLDLQTRIDQWAERAAKTESMAAANETYREMYAKEGVEQVQLVTRLDDRTCAFCLAHHGNIYPISEAPHLPFHPNCRCVYVPYNPE